MKITKAPLEGLLIIEPRVFTDTRGYFYESFQQERYTKAGMPLFVQDNVSRSTANTLRGLHFQQPHAQGKLVWASQGSVWDVAIDIRTSSPTFGEWYSINLSSDNHLQMYIPPGFAHGFCVLSDTAIFHYKCTDYYAPECERGIRWNDPKLNIPWPVSNPVLSDKDNTYPTLDEMTHAQLFA